MKKEFKEMLYKSLTEDINDWRKEACGAADWSWTEYWNKSYGSRKENNEISFCVGSLNFGTCVYVNGQHVMSFKVLPFSKLHKAIKDMKKHIKSNKDKEFNDMLRNVLDSRNKEVKVNG